MHKKQISEWWKYCNGITKTLFAVENSLYRKFKESISIVLTLISQIYSPLDTNSLQKSTTYTTKNYKIIVWQDYVLV